MSRGGRYPALGTGVLQDNGTQGGIGTASPVTDLSIYDAGQSTTLTNFTQALTNGGLNIMSGYTANAYTPGIFWSTANDNPTKPKAGIWTEDTASGSYLNFGTTNTPATGITNQALVIDPSGQCRDGIYVAVFRLANRSKRRRDRGRVSNFELAAKT